MQKSNKMAGNLRKLQQSDRTRLVKNANNDFKPL